MSKINKTDLFLTICSLGMLIPFPLFGATDSFTEDCRALTRDNHRLTGTPEYARAAEYVKKRLQEIGVDRLITQPFATAQTDIARCELQFAEKQKSLPLLPMRPNGVITASALPKA